MLIKILILIPLFVSLFLAIDDEAKCGIEFATRIFADPAYQQCFNESFSIFGADGKIDCSKNPPQACMEFAKKADEIISPECKEFFAEDFEQDVAADVESWEEACKEFNAAGNSGADDNNIDIALDDAAQNAEDAANTVAADAQNNLDDAKDAIADATDGAFTVSTISFALAVFAALY